MSVDVPLNFLEAMALAQRRSKEPPQKLVSAGESAPSEQSDAWLNAISGKVTDGGNSWFGMLDIAAAAEAKATAAAFAEAGKTRCSPEELEAARQRVAAAQDEWRTRASRA